MAEAFTCPFCSIASVLRGEDITSQRYGADDGNRFGPLQIVWTMRTCPNPECKEPTLDLFVRPGAQVPSGPIRWAGDPLLSVRLRPLGASKVFPDFVPQAIRDDYREACAIRDLSPKASATLARRALQGMLRDFWKVNAGNLVNEIAQIEDRVQPATWDAINAVRQIGNIGAHMEKDINVIVDVDPDEAQILIELFESLVEDWYIDRHNRAERLARVRAIADEKKALQKGVIQTPPASPDSPDTTS